MPKKRKLITAMAVMFGLVVMLPETRGQGVVYTWGLNDSGQLGNGTNSNSFTPTPVTGLGSGVTAISGGGNHSLAVINGAAYAWGYNGLGQLGNGTTADSNIPVPVAGLSSGVTSVSAGQLHSLAIVNASAYGWGRNNSGQLGNGTNIDSNIPVAAIGQAAVGVVRLSAGGAHSLAVTLFGAGNQAWGFNNYGQLGNSSYADSNSPVAVSGLGIVVTSLSAGGLHSLAVVNGAAYSWGDNTYGQLGDGTTNGHNIAIAVPALGSSVTSVGAGYYHSLAVKNGSVFAWGYNGYGELGDGTNNNSSVPVQVGGALTGLIVEQVSAGVYFSMALTTDHRLFTWGQNDYGQLGDGTLFSSNVPVEVFAPSGFMFSSIEAGEYHAMAILVAVPEPGSILLISAIAVGMVGYTRFRRRQTSDAGLTVDGDNT